MDLENLKGYLKDTNQEEFLNEIREAQDQGLNNGEILCSFYAKSCYASLTNKKNKNITKTRDIENNIKSIIESGHGCYDEKTEVYTKDGWKFWPEVTNNDVFATLNSNGQLEWHKSINLVKYDYSGKMIEFKNRLIDLFVTPNHNMLVCQITTKEGRRGKNFNLFKLRKVEEILNIPHSHIKTLPTKVIIKSDLNPLYQLLGFAIGDGNITWDKLSFHLRRQRKIIYLKNLCNKLGIALEIGKNDTYRIKISKLDEVTNLSFREVKEFDTRELFNLIYDENKQKRIPNIIINNYYNNYKLLSSLLDGMMNSDGCIQEKSSIYDTTSSFLAGQFQFMLNLLGISCNISDAICYKREGNRNYLNRCSVIRNDTKPEFNKSLDLKYPKPNLIENWNGIVYCAEVPNHTLFVRRFGKAVWCGNSVIEHCNLNFMITDCSRVFTHEMVRHRIGTAFSQTSGRYVRTDQLNVVIDPILEPVYDLVEECRDYLEKWYKRLEERLKINEDKNFSIKKKKTSAMRRMLPNGQANEIGVTLNLRALRHTIEMRTASHAEWEIRYIFGQIYKIVKEKYPVMFFDSKEEIVDDLLEIKFDNKKI